MASISSIRKCLLPWGLPHKDRLEEICHSAWYWQSRVAVLQRMTETRWEIGYSQIMITKLCLMSVGSPQWRFSDARRKVPEFLKNHYNRWHLTSCCECSVASRSLIILTPQVTINHFLNPARPNVTWRENSAHHIACYCKMQDCGIPNTQIHQSMSEQRLKLLRHPLIHFPTVL